MKNSKEAFELISRAHAITLLTHKKPDGDGIAACRALEITLTRMGKVVESVYPDEPEFTYACQPENVHVNKHIQTPDLIIALDTANASRMYMPDAFTDVPLINIDHHVSNSIQGTYNFVVPEASSACEVLYGLLLAWNIDIDADLAETILFGILYDSQIFHTQSTRSETLRIAADLMDKGAQLFKLKVELLAHKDPTIINVWKELLDRITVSDDVVWTYVTQADLKKHNVTLSSCVGFNNFLASISQVDVTLLFYETETGETKVSLRSREYDVNTLAAKFGGGGHTHAAGILSDKPLQVLMDEVIDAI